MLEDVLSIFIPHRCAVCDDLLSDHERFVCTGCRFDAPLTGFCYDELNPMVERLQSLLPVRRASALLWFTEDSVWQRMIHRFKYNQEWTFARRYGEWLGSSLVDSGLYADVDVVVPVPLHLRRMLKRGYNQSDMLAFGVGKALGVKVERFNVVRIVDNPSQTQLSSADRWNNVDGIFSVRHPEKLAGKHILLIDDVFTTGATLAECGITILKNVPDVTLSVATLATTRHGMMIDR